MPGRNRANVDFSPFAVDVAMVSPISKLLATIIEPRESKQCKTPLSLIRRSSTRADLHLPAKAELDEWQELDRKPHDSFFLR
jgi:hypothetical protein